MKLAFQVIVFLTGLLLSLLVWGWLFVFATICRADEPWFIGPTAAYVFPLNSSIVYHSYEGTVHYKDGYSTCIEAGRYFGPFKVYASYDYTSFQDKGFTLSTPYGKVYQSDNSNYNGQTLMANADYIFTRSYFGFRPFAGIGMGETFDGGTNTSIEARAGVSRTLWKSWTASLSYSYRWTQGSITSGHVSVEEPKQEKLTLCISKQF